MERITLPVTETQLVVDVILKGVPQFTVFVIGYRNTHILGNSLLSTQEEHRNTKHHFSCFHNGFFLKKIRF